MKNIILSISFIASTTICAAQQGKPFTEKDATDSTVPNLYLTQDANNAYYDFISDFRLDEDSKSNYEEAIKATRYNKVPSTLISPKLAKEWIPLYHFKEKRYLYAPSEWGFHYRIMIDKAGVFVEYLMEGAQSSLITQFQELSKDRFAFTVVINDQEEHYIATFKDKDQQLLLLKNLENNVCILLASKKIFSTYPLLFIHNENEKQVEFTFENTPCE